MAYSYKVVRPFIDKEDGKEYKVGDEFPTDITNERVEQLFHKQNVYNEQYIALDVDAKATKAELLEIAEKHNVDVSQDDTNISMSHFWFKTTI